MLRLTLHRQGQDSHVCTRCHTMVCRGSRNYGSHDRARAAGFGYRPTPGNVGPSTDRRWGFLRARSDRASTLGEVR
jgi:hypothetical protein